MDKGPEIRSMSPQLLVKDMERSIEFYTKRLGFRYEDFYAGIIKEDYSTHLKLKDPSANGNRGERTDADPAIIFSVEGVEDLYRELVDQRVVMVQPLVARDYGREFYIADPDGHILAFLEEA